MGIAVTADIIGSRRLPDRDAAQALLDAAIRKVEAETPGAIRPLRPTVGDEQQGVYATLDDALRSLLLLQLALPDGIACRYGVGVGAIGSVDSAGGGIPDGPGWWAARAAIEKVHAMEQRSVPTARTWVAADPDESDEVHETVRRANLALLGRDALVVAMSERARRLTYGRCVGVTQRELAAAEGITQSAVSQALAHAGAPAIVAGFRLLGGK